MTPASSIKKTVTLFFTSIAIATLSSLVTGCSPKQVMIVPNLSMAPTLKIGERVPADFLAYRVEDPQRGDLAIFIPRNLQDPGWVFRVAAVPGETLSYKEDVLQRNQETIPTPSSPEHQVYRSPKKTNEGVEMTFPYTLKENEYFFLSDNPNYTHDSRFWGPIERTEIVGKLANH